MAVRLSSFLVVSAFTMITTNAALGQAATTPPVLEPPSQAITAEPEILLPPVNAAIRDLLEKHAEERGFLDSRDIDGLTAFYAARGYAPAWIKDDRLNERSRALIARIARADEDGLDARSYVLPPTRVGEDGAAGPLTFAQVDLLTSQAIAAYAREAYGGRVDPASMGSNIGLERHLPDTVKVLTAVMLADDPVGMLESYNPSHAEFAALRQRLAELRASHAEAKRPPVLPEGANLRLGSKDPRVPLLRERFNLSADVEAPDIYDEEVAEAVKTFQRAHGLKTDGILGPASLAVLNQGQKDPIPLILANMERWRWMPRDLGDFYVRVDIPDYTLSVIRDGEVAYTTRVVVGKSNQQTPVFSDQIDHLVVNPSWNVPASIARKEMLPAARANPGSLRGYQVLANIGGRYRVVDPWRIDWHRIDMRQIRFRQPPGERNALGNIKFMFPNRYAVYLHDTPSKSLFQRDQRAFSHGCVRVMDPMAFADALLAEETDLNAARLQRMIGGDEKWVNLKKPVPVHLTYFTAWIDSDGELQTRRDIYGHDKRLETALGLGSEST